MFSCVRRVKWIREKRVLNVSQGEFLVLLLVVQPQNDPTCWLVIRRVREKPFHLSINVCSERHDLIQRRAGKGSTQLLFRNLIPERVVIAVEKPTKLFAKGFVI